MLKALRPPRVFDGETFRENVAVVIDGARIAAVVPHAEVPATAEVIELQDGFLAPGFIDVQVNGGGGVLLNETPTIDGITALTAAHRRFGTVGLLPTVITDAQTVIERAIAAAEQAVVSVPGVLGLHIEGPFLDVERKGAHAARFIREMTAEDIARLRRVSCPLMLTVAPNRVSAAQVKQLADGGILVSLGHAEASYDEAVGALDAGARSFTHLFNAMSQMSGREPSMVGAALSRNDCYAGLIADGFHVHDAALHAAHAAKGAARLVLVSDAMPSAAGGPSTFELQGRPVRREEGRLTLLDGTLAGSDLTMDQAVRYCTQKLGWPLADVLKMASRTPAEFLKRGNELGRIVPGYRASLVHLTDDLAVKRVWVDGA